MVSVDVKHHFYLLTARPLTGSRYRVSKETETRLTVVRANGACRSRAKAVFPSCQGQGNWHGEGVFLDGKGVRGGAGEGGVRGGGV